MKINSVFLNAMVWFLIYNLVEYYEGHSRLPKDNCNRKYIVSENSSNTSMIYMQHVIYILNASTSV